MPITGGDTASRSSALFASSLAAQPQEQTFESSTDGGNSWTISFDGFENEVLNSVL